MHSRKRPRSSHWPHPPSIETSVAAPQAIDLDAAIRALQTGTDACKDEIFRAIFDAWHQPVVRVVARACRNHDPHGHEAAAVHALHDFFGLLEKHQFRIRNARQLLFAIAHRRGLDAYRKQRNWQKRFCGWEPSTELRLGFAASPVDVLESRDLLEHLDQFMSGSGRSQTLLWGVVRRYVAGRVEPQIVATLAKTKLKVMLRPKTVTRTLRRMLKSARLCCVRLSRDGT